MASNRPGSRLTARFWPILQYRIRQVSPRLQVWPKQPRNLASRQLKEMECHAFHFFFFKGKRYERTAGKAAGAGAVRARRCVRRRGSSIPQSKVPRQEGGAYRNHERDWLSLSRGKAPYRTGCKL